MPRLVALFVPWRAGPARSVPAHAAAVLVRPCGAQPDPSELLAVRGRQQLDLDIGLEVVAIVAPPTPAPPCALHLVVHLVAVGRVRVEARVESLPHVEPERED